VRRGFKPTNLIAVERNPAVVRELRAVGTTVIEGALLDVVKSWPDKHAVSVVIADFQCGFTDMTADFIEATTKHPAFDDCFVVLNLQRGRDIPLVDVVDFASHLPKTHRGFSVGAWFSQCVAEDYAACMKYLNKAWALGGRVAARNRAFKVEADAILVELKNAAALSLEELKLKRLRVIKLSQKAKVTAKFLTSLEEFRNRVKKNNEVRSFKSYQSTKRSPVFDNAYFCYKSFLPRVSQPFDQSVRQRIIAALAVRTRRKNEKVRA
jgi:hypothetical protein